MNPGEKRCPRCATVKPASDFYTGESYLRSPGKLSPYCRVCHKDINAKAGKARRRELARKYYREDRDKILARGEQYRERVKQTNPARWRAQKFFSGKRKDIAPDVTRAYIEELFLKTTHCQCCGRELCLEYAPREDRNWRSNYAAPSIDRANNQRGYTRNNIGVICWQCNHRKTDLTLADINMFEKYIRRCGDV